jgi:uncharacterized protein YPO0396
MQLSVFSTDSEKSGFRLQYMEVFNWGTFDNTIHAIRPGGETSLLTGANGSGKTTFVDALLTLIVPEKKYRFYNQSSGSEKKGDRTEDSYVLGGYGSINSELTGASKTLYLRENKDEAYSILLAHFANEADQVVTLFQVRYFVNGDMKKIFAVAHKALQIETDFKPFDFGGQWKKTIEQRYNKGARKQVEWFDAASKYAQRLVDVLGMQSIQALHLFNQTVGIKVLGNLDEFIRMHMLEPRNMEEQFQELKKHLATLLDARRNIAKTEAQIALLQNLKQYFEKYNALSGQMLQLEIRLQTARIWNSYTRYELLTTALEGMRHTEKELMQQLAALKTDLAKWAEEERQTRNQIDQNKAGQRMQQLEKEMEELQEKVQQMSLDLRAFSDWCQTLHLPETDAADEAAYQRIKKENDRNLHKIEREQRLNEEDDYEAKRTREKADEERIVVEEELNHLLHSKNNIPAHLMMLRSNICKELSIDNNELPFAGELMQVDSEASEWQPALEKLLHSYALRLLVPDKLYKKVNKYVNQTNLRTRLVYEHVTDNPLEQHPEAGTVCEKLEFHPDHKLGRWVKQQIIRQYDYMCLGDEKNIDRYHKAITLNGLVKNGQRHEKDDRTDRNDPSRYVMGWNNEKKKERLLQKRHKLADEITNADEVLKRCHHKRDRIGKQFYAATRIKEHAGFASLNVAAINKEIQKKQEQVKALRNENKALDNLKKQLQDIVVQKENTEAQQKEFISREAILQQEKQRFTTQLDAIAPLVAQLTPDDKDSLLHFQQQQAQLLAQVDLQNIDSLYIQLKDSAEAELRTATEQANKAEGSVNKGIYQIKNPGAQLMQQYPDWMGDVQQLPDDAKYAAEYIEWMEKLETENLPQYKKDFESYISDTMTYKIGSLNEDLVKWERDIHTSVQKLNQSLGGINFNRMPDTYIQLRMQPVPAGTEIKEFRSRLLDALPQGTSWQQSGFEEKSLHFTQKVQPLISELDMNENWRNKVLDVRNWFEFWADEKFRANDEQKKTYRQMGQLSGGEKAQLTYTILCSAIAYQFGITREGRSSRSLRFIAVDESFSNQDEEKATYLMELCKQLHLQLLVVTPSDKIQIVQDFIAHVHLVQRVGNRHSVVYNMTIKELQRQMGKLEEPATEKPAEKPEQLKANKKAKTMG